MSTGRFQKGETERQRRGGLRSGQVKKAQAMGSYPPYTGTIADMLDALEVTGDSYLGIRTVLKASRGMGLTDAELAFYQEHTSREAPPVTPPQEVGLVCGRRSGKSRGMGIAGFYAGIRFDTTKLAPGETAVVVLIAPDRRQARQLLGYVRGIAEHPEFSRYVDRVLKESIELKSGVLIEVRSASFRTARGFTAVACFVDEAAFLRTDDGAANPDTEILNAVRPSMLTVEGAQLFLASSPYASRGELYRMYADAFGTDDPHVLVFNASTEAMNPTVPSRLVKRAFEDDPVAAASEYGADGFVQFRTDVESFLDPEAVAAVTISGRRELPPVPGIRYRAFVDPSGGSQDSFTLAIAHQEGEVGILDAVRETRPPFSPDSVVEDYAKLLGSYGIREVVGDRYGGIWPASRFTAHGITYTPSERTKSDIYAEFLAPINSGTVELLDIPVLRAQLVGLERRVSRSGKDSIDHARGGRDDVANAAAGALGLLTVEAKSGAVFGTLVMG